MIVAVIVLAVILTARELASILERRAWQQERTHLVHLVAARTPAEAASLDRATIHAPKVAAKADDLPEPKRRMIGA